MSPNQSLQPTAGRSNALAFYDFNSKLRSEARCRQRWLSLFSLDGEERLVFGSVLRHYPDVTFTVETEQESDGRWIAEVAQIPGAMAYGSAREEAVARVRHLDFACSPNASSGARAHRRFSRSSPSQLHEPVGAQPRHDECWQRF